MDKSLLISKIIEHYNLSRNVDFANFFGISEQNAYGWKRGGYNVYTVYQRCKEINPEWLLSDGEVGGMLREEKKEDTTMHEDCRQLLEQSLGNMQSALDRIAEEQAISKQVLSQTDKVLALVREVQSKE